VKADPDDDKIVECAAAARSDYIVTGDKHLLKLRKWLTRRLTVNGMAAEGGVGK
jgi:predicted nucleic acid-binding protein